MLKPDTTLRTDPTHKIVDMVTETTRRKSLVTTIGISRPARPFYSWAKRSLDLSLSLFALLIFGLPMLVIAAIVKLTSPGPVLFRQERLGKDCQPFIIYKFRSMYSDTSAETHRQYIQQLIQGSDVNVAWLPKAKDSRVTPVGRWLRRTGLDELPQLFNVVKGEMSLVGPRPPLRYEVELYQSWQLERMTVLPGITGLWQVAGRGQASFDEMVRQDVEYVQRGNLVLDFWIIVMTVPRRLLGSLRYQR